MVKRIIPAPAYSRRIYVSEFRRRLSHFISEVRHGGDFVCIRRKGEENVYLISQADWDLLSSRIDDLESGKRDPESGMRKGGLWRWLNWDHHQEMMQEWRDRQRTKRHERE